MTTRSDSSPQAPWSSAATAAHAPVAAEATIMQAIVFRRYGSPDVLEHRNVEAPVPKDDEVLVRVRATGLNPADWRLMRGEPLFFRMAWGLRNPRGTAVFGGDISGEVVATGNKVQRFRPGDEVFAEVDSGGCAELVAVKESRLGRKPANLTFEEAAVVPMAAITALQALRDSGRIRPGQHLLVNGASGGIGTFAVQIAKAFGAEVTGVCSTRNLDLVRSIGADHVIDYTREDFTAGTVRYDLILDTVGNHSLAAFRRALGARGTLVVTGGGGGRWLGPLPQVLQATLVSPFVRHRLVAVIGTPNSSDLDVLTDLIEAGAVTPVIDRAYGWTEVPEAIRYLETRHTRGKLVVASPPGAA